MKEKLRNSGIDIIGSVPWGTHFCQFYQTTEDLIDILVPYFKAGLENNELCMWITSQPLEVEEAKKALRKTVHDIDVYLEKGQMEIVPYTHGYLKEGIFDSERVVNSWVEKIDQVLERGYDGLRAAGDNRWLENKGWNSFVDYENKVDAIIDKYHVIALCPYYLDMCNTAETIDIVSNHQFALIKREGKWERIDNSGRKRAEKEAIQAAKNWKHTFDAVPDLIAIIDDKYRVARANRAMAARLGITPEECVGLTCYRVIHGTDKPPSFCPHWQLLKDETEHAEEVCEDCLGDYFAVSTSPLHDSEGKLIGSVYVAHDINERKQEEHRIRRYNRILEGINRIFSNVVQAKTEEEVGNACLSVALEVTGSEFGFISETGADGLLHDVAKSELAWKQCLMYDKTGHRRPPLSDFIVHGLYGSVINNEKSFFTNDPRSHPDSIGLPRGHPPITSFLGAPLVQGRKTVGLIAVANRKGGYSSEQQEDLEAIVPAVIQALQRKRSEEALKKAHTNLEKLVEERTAELEKAYNSLKESEKGLAEAQKIAHLGNWEWDIATDKAYWSDELFRIFGSEPQESGATYNELLNYIHPDDRNYMDNAHKNALNGKSYNVEYRIIRENGEERKVHMRSKVIFDEKNVPIRLKGIVQDITELKRAEEKIQTLANAVESSNDAIVTVSLDGIIASWNKAAEHIYGYSVEEILGKDVSVLEPDNFKGEIRQFFEKIKQGKKVQHYETSRLKKDGTIINISVSLSPIYDVTGKLVAISAIVRDVTERIKADEALRESEARLRQFYESDLIGVFYYNLNGSITDANDKFLEILGYTREDLQAGEVNWNKMTPPEYRYIDEQCIAEMKNNGLKEPKEKEYIRKDGSRVPIILGAAIFDRECQEGIAFIIDNTERKKAEKALVEMDRVRIKEIHHRIKNNLQVITSLLDLQAEKFRDKKVLEAFRESQNRVISMSLIHEELYKGKGADTLDFSAYLRKLAESLFKTYSLSNKNIHLSMDLEERSFFDMDTAVPLGIIVNELVSNSLKHAFPNKEGEIRIQLRKEKKCNESNNSLFSLIVSDNGIGIPKDIELASFESLGMSLVNILVDQLDGKIELIRSHGTEFRITFNVTERSQISERPGKED